MNKYVYYITFFILLNIIVKAQVIYINNPSNHIVAYNPAFSAINSTFNKNYISNQVGLSARASKQQTDVLASGQYFSEKRNLGVSAHYNYINQNKSNFQKAGIGLSYHLLFFNEVSTGWGIGLSYNNLYADTNLHFSVYNEQGISIVKSSTYASLNFGGLINYENILIGFSVQPKQCVYFTSDKKGTFYTMVSFYLKYKYSISRSVNTTIWYNGNWNEINNLQFFNANFRRQKIQTHSLNIHLSGKKGFVAGIGIRVANVNYVSAIIKAGYNAKRWQLVYGIEPYWLHAKYSEIIHELSFTLKLN